MLAVLGSLGVPELLVIFLILVLLFGARKLPQIGRGIGEGIRNLKTGLNTGDDEDEGDGEEKTRYERKA